MVRIGEEADIEHEVGVRRHASAVGEGEHEDRGRPLGLRLEARSNDVAQIADGKSARVEGDIRSFADPAEQSALARNSLNDRLVMRQRMRTAGLAEASAQHLGLAIEEEQGDLAWLVRAEQRLEVALDLAGVEPPGAGIDAERERAPLPVLAPRLDQLREQREGQVVDRFVAEVFQNLERRRLAGAGHSGHQHEGAIAGGLSTHQPAERSACACRPPAAARERASRTFAGADASNGASITCAIR